MGFTTPCFIRKNTKELRDKLKELGYCVVGKSLPCIKTNVKGRLYIAEQAYEFELNERIDCGTNEELFLAIAALRPDSDIHQWFTDGKKWVISDVHTLIELKEYFEEINFDYLKTHKATVEELIEHFK